MSKSLTDQYINNTYTGILHSDLSLPENGQSTIYDGEGNESSLQLGRSCNGATICGKLTVDDLEVDTVTFNNNSLINKIYPIGSVYFSLTDSNPSTTIGGGWDRIADGKFIVGVGSGVDTNSTSSTFNVESNNGEYSHSLTEAEMPAHRHGMVSPDGTQFYLFNDSNFVPGANDQADGAFRADGPEDGNDGQYWPNMQYSGGNQKHNNIPPSFGLYVWKRVS